MKTNFMTEIVENTLFRSPCTSLLAERLVDVDVILYGRHRLIAFRLPLLSGQYSRIVLT